jgi:transposase-like protein
VDWHFPYVERLQAFKPRFCPRAGCPEHRRTSRGFRFRNHGSYRLKSGRTVKRFRCTTCRSSFGLKAFSLSYYLKRPELLCPIAAGLQAGSAHRQLARTLGCAPSTVTRQAARIGRHCMLLHERALHSMDTAPHEPIVFDHFETFEFTQDLPFGVATAVGADSWFVYAIDPAPHRRAGRRSPAQQKRLRSRPRREHHGGYTGSAFRTFRRLLSIRPQGSPLRLIVDDHPAYRAARARLAELDRPQLEVHPNPLRGPKGSARSAIARARDRAMFPVDLLHGLIRHSTAAHKREGIAFGRRLNALMERLYVFLAWRNFIKGRSERKPDPETPAMRLGLCDRPWNWRELLARRLFPAREGLAGVGLELYRREWTTPVLPRNRRHDLKLAY